MEDTNQMTTRRALTVVGLLAFLIIVTLIMPAKWVGIGGSTSAKRGTSLLLKDPSEFASLKRDMDKNSNPDWKDLLNETTSTTTRAAASKVTVTDSDKKRLADPNNLTASFSKNMYTVSAYAQKNGELSGEEQQQIVSNLLTEESKKIIIKTYEVGDIRVAKTESAVSQKEYGNNLGKLITKADTYKLGSSDVAIIEAYNTNKDPAPLASFVIKKNNVASIIKELLAMSVPSSAAPYHLLIINRLSEYQTTLDNFSQVATDPIRATISFNNYMPLIKGLASSFSSIKTYFAVQQIIFNSNEAGYIFTSGPTNP